MYSIIKIIIRILGGTIMFSIAIFMFYAVILIGFIIELVGSQIVKVYSSKKDIENQYERYLEAQNEDEGDEE